MKKQKLIHSNIAHLNSLFNKVHPLTVELARKSLDINSFRKALKEQIEQHASSLSKEDTRLTKAEHFTRIIDYDGKKVQDLSTGAPVTLEPITLLWDLLNGRITNESKARPDLFIDLYQQFNAIFQEESEEARGKKKIINYTKRWSSGLEESVISIRQKNKDRIIRKLIHKIDNNSHTNAIYHFHNDSTYQEKYTQVDQWWQTSQFHLSFAIKNPSTLNYFLDETLSKETIETLSQAKKKGIPFFITPYYLSLLDTDHQIDDHAIRSYIIYSKELVESYGTIKAWEKEDLIETGKPNAAGWLLPEGNNIHRRYPEVAIFIPDSMGRACGGLCASCQRMYDFQSKRFNFDLESLKPKEGWNKKQERLMQYFEEDTQIRDILLTGGDALMSQNATLKNILNAIYRMAKRKRTANQNRPNGTKYCELQRIRIGSRLPAYLPMRITDELISILRNFREKAIKIGITQFIVQTHFQSSLEVTPEAQKAIKAIIDAGWIITNQSVYTVAISRRGHTTHLRKILNQLGVISYYTFTVKGFEENYKMFTPNARSLQEMAEEKAWGHLTQEQEDELKELLQTTKWDSRILKKFLQKHHLPFTATDRNTINLPGIGKSMTFNTVGILPDGRRVLEFAHDQTRRHSPKVEMMDNVFIAESKSIAAYLRQLQSMGERYEDYQSIWYYTEGETERRFSFFEYPEFEYTPTTSMNHLE